MKKVVLGLLGLMSIVSCSKNDDVLTEQFEGTEVRLDFERLGYQQWFEGNCQLGQTNLWYSGPIDLGTNRELLVGNCVDLLIDGNVYGSGTIVIYDNSTVTITGNMSDDIFVYVTGNSQLIN